MIRLLPESLINQIAAGEVVERPASVVKELIENAIDAKATRIDVQVKNAGKEEIVVIDDGEGMSQEDAFLALKRHATSKIADAGDLTHILTMGFRGEALASIAAVSKLTLETRLKERNSGTRIVSEGEKMTHDTEVGCPPGTSIRVADLFFNTPARRKYLKSDTTELNHSIGTVTEIALAFPEIHFRLTSNGHVIFDAARSEEPLDRIRVLLGKDTASHLIPIFYGGEQVQVKGFIGKPEITRGTKFAQHLFVNQRAIKNNALAYAVSEGFHTLMPQGRYPVFIMNIIIDPSEIDVNVHPRKLEIRFQNQEALFQIIKKAVKMSLETHVLAPKIALSRPQFQTSGQEEVVIEPHGTSDRKHIPLTPSFHQQLPTVNEALKFTEKWLTLSPIAQVAASYIIAREDNGIVIIDQHAAHERYMYEKFMKTYGKKKEISQALLIPCLLELSHREVEMLKSQKEILENLGFEIEHRSMNAFHVTSIPSCLRQDDIRDVILGVLDDCIKEEIGKSVEEKREKLLTFMACRSAIKFGRMLTTEEQFDLVRKLENLDQKYTCPHGRPTMIRLSYQELEKRFGRR